MKIAMVQFSPWDKIYDFDLEEHKVKKGDYVIVNTELGMEMGQVVGFKDNDACGGCKACGEKEGEKKQIKPIIRKAGERDLEKLPKKKEKDEALNYCRNLIKKHNLAMKLVDVCFSFDGSRITFAFIADGRIDFRDLVKDLTRHYNKTVRLHQIGIRDEAKIMGDYGHCGRELCCRNFLEDLNSITSEMAERQQVIHRGSDRISGICGRLMCCLAYEEEGYDALRKQMPVIGTKVNVDGKRGVVVGQNILKQSVNVSFSNGNGDGNIISEVDLNRNKK
jgi:cell fate regulator YaaT (PSP1 superfamily)